MKYSTFIYLAAMAASNYHDPSATYESFLLGQLSEQEDFVEFIEGAYHEANAFFQRVSSLGKVPTRVATFDEVGADEAAELVMGDDFLKPVAVFQYRDERHQKYDSLAFKKLGNKVYVVGRYSPYRKIHVQYRPKIAMLGKGDIAFIEETNEGYFVKGTAYTLSEAFEAAEALQVDLESAYGLSDELLYIGIDWIKGRLNQEASQGHSQEMEAESRLNDFEMDEFLFTQRNGGRL